MPIERLSAADFKAAAALAKERGCTAGEALDHIAGRKHLDAPGRPASLPMRTPWTVETSDDLLHLMAGSLPEAGEETVENEIRDLLSGRLGAHNLSDYGPNDTPPAGTLVDLWTTHKRRPVGISAGAPDLWLARVGCWGWLGIELKARSKKGRMGGRLSPEQAVAVRAQLYAVAWAPAHVAMLVESMDARNGVTPATPKGTQ